MARRTQGDPAGSFLNSPRADCSWGGWTCIGHWAMQVVRSLSGGSQVCMHTYMHTGLHTATRPHTHIWKRPGTVGQGPKGRTVVGGSGRTESTVIPGARVARSRGWEAGGRAREGPGTTD